MPAPPGEPSIVIVPWSDVVEDYLDTIGRSLDDYVQRMSGGWLFGYVDALRAAGAAAAVACVSRSVDVPTRVVHAATQAPLWLLPQPAAHRLVRRTLRGRRPSTSRYLATPARALAHVARAERATALLCQEYESPRFDRVVALGRRVSLPVFATFQGANRPRSRAETLPRRWSMRHAAGFVVAASDERARVRAAYGVERDRVVGVFNPIDVDEWQPGNRTTARAALGIGAERRVVAWHGRVEFASKGLDVLLAAWDELRRGRPDATLLLVGSGRDAPRLRTAIAQRGDDSVRWDDEYVLDRDRLRLQLAAADVWAFPSRHEGFPVAPVEAMACGLPVVAADANGVRDIFESGERDGGVVVAREDHRALARELGALLDEPGRARTMGVAARARVVERFSLHAVGTELRDFFAARGAGM
jgi:starch synthase